MTRNRGVYTNLASVWLLSMENTTSVFFSLFFLLSLPPPNQTQSSVSFGFNFFRIKARGTEIIARVRLATIVWCYRFNGRCAGWRKKKREKKHQRSRREIRKSIRWELSCETRRIQVVLIQCLTVCSPRKNIHKAQRLNMQSYFTLVFFYYTLFFFFDDIKFDWIFVCWLEKCKCENWVFGNFWLTNIL